MNYRLTDICTIKELLGEENFRFSKSKGQNFLKEQWVVERTADEGCPEPDCGVLEIGPGIGCLTAELSRRSKKVVSVEIDENLRTVLNKTLAGLDNIKVIYGDIMKMNLQTVIDEEFADVSHLAVCANLPYNITTPVLTKLVECHKFEQITVMIQKEVADRICAQAGSSEWGAFSVLMQWNCETEKLYDVSRECFIPAPKVTSSVIRLLPRRSKPYHVTDEKFMFQIVRAVFNQRRKTMANSVSHAFPSLKKESIVSALNQMGYSENVRGETLSLQNFADFTNLISDTINSAAL